MEFQIEGKCVVKLEHKKGANTSEVVSSSFNLDVSKNLDRSMYLDKEGVPTAAGSKALTQCFVQGLIGNIHQAHQKGLWHDVKHLEYIIAELQRGFVSIADARTGEFHSEL